MRLVSSTRVCEHCKQPFPRPRGITVKKYLRRRFCSKPCERLALTPTMRVCAFVDCTVSFKPAKTHQRHCSRSCGNKTRGNPKYRKILIDGVQKLEHRHVMETILGRPLYPWESVHHKNGIRLQNEPDNLELWAKPQPSGQRVSDLVAFVLRYYDSDVRKAMAA